MKIAVFGGTGMIGSRIVSEAAARGHQVSSVSRRADGHEIDGVTPLTADVRDADTVARLAGDHDAVVSAIGPVRGPGGDHQDFLDAIRGFIDNAGAARLLVVGGAGSLLSESGQPLFDVDGFPESYRPEARAQGAALDLLRHSPAGVDWTYLSPAPEIGPGERTGDYLVGDDHPAGARISAEDYAVAVLDELESPAHRRTRYTVAN